LTVLHVLISGEQYLDQTNSSKSNIGGGINTRMLLSEFDDASVRRIDMSPLRRKFTNNLDHLMALIDHYGFKVRIVGGAVRDVLIGRIPRDIDLITDALPDAVMFILNKHKLNYRTKGIPHGTVKVVFDDDEEYEITSLGYEVEDECCPKTVVIHSGQSWRGDANRRDFTIDTLSVNLDGLLYDYVGGLKDLRHQFIRFIGSPAERIQKDPILIMRFFKLLSMFRDPKFDKSLLPLIKEKMKLVKKIKPDRLEKEISTIKENPNGTKVIQLMKDLGAGEFIEGLGETEKETGKETDKES
jgi:tRNA nucleotidyltransferase (CCA-adding enzyme)